MLTSWCNKSYRNRLHCDTRIGCLDINGYIWSAAERPNDADKRRDPSGNNDDGRQRQPREKQCVSWARTAISQVIGRSS